MHIIHTIKNFINQLFSLPVYTDPDERQKSRVLHIAAAASFAGVSSLLFAWLLMGSTDFLPLILTLIALAAAYLLHRSGRLSLAIALWLITILSLTAYFVTLNDGSHDSALFILPAVFIFSAFMLKRNAYFILVLLLIFSFNLIIWLEYSSIFTARFSRFVSPSDGIDITIILLLTAYVVYRIVRSLTSNLKQSRESEARFREIFEGSAEAILIADTDNGNIIAANRAACQLFGNGKCELTGRHILSFFPEDFRSSFTELFMSFCDKEDKPARHSIEGFVLRHGGIRIPAETSLANIRLNGKKCVMGIFRDISERKENEKKILGLLREKETLLKEVHHRIKNNLQSIYSLLIFQAELQKDANVSDKLREAAGRLQTMTVLYKKLYQNNSDDYLNAAGYINDLIENIKKLIIQPGFFTFSVKIDEIALHSKTLTAVGAILNELITNSIKHAFTGRTEGKITIGLCREEDRLKLTYSDDGTGMPGSVTPEDSDGFGLQFIALQVQQLHGEMKTDSSRGTSYTILFREIS